MASRRPTVPPGVEARLKYARARFREAQISAHELGHETQEQNVQLDSMWAWRERMAKLLGVPAIHPKHPEKK